MIDDRTGRLRVGGADLYYTVRGSGPTILLLPSGGHDANGADRLVAHLAARHTVLTYDRRGQSRTTVDDPHRRVTIRRHADDAAALATYLFGAPVSAVGCSTGAVIGLELVRHRPELISVLVAHEPPLREFATDPERNRHDLAIREVRRLVREVGWQPAIQTLRSSFGDPPLDPLDYEDEMAWEPPNRRTIANLCAFLATEAGETWHYHVDDDGWNLLRSAPTVIVPATGNDPGTFPSRCSAELAQKLGTKLIELPGGHEGYQTHPKAFAGALLNLLDTARDR